MRIKVTKVVVLLLSAFLCSCNAGNLSSSAETSARSSELGFDESLVLNSSFHPETTSGCSSNCDVTSESIEIDNGFLAIRFDEFSSDGPYLTSDELLFELDSENSTNIDVKNDCLLIKEGGVFAFTLDGPIKTIKFSAISDTDINMRVGLINKYGIQAFYNPDICGSSVEFSYKDSQTANHIIIDSVSEVSLKEILVLKKE